MRKWFWLLLAAVWIVAIAAWAIATLFRRKAVQEE